MKLAQLLGRPQLGPRIIFTTDWHARARAPKNRTDNFRQALLDKLSWCMDAGEKLGAEKTMVCGGDVFDIPTPSLEVADEIIDLFLARDWKLATALGNHDLDGAIASALRTLLGHLMRRGFVTLLPMFDHAPLMIGGIAFWGHHYAYGNHNDSLIISGYNEFPKAIVSHAMFLEKPAVFEHTLWSDISTNCELLLLGHYHPQQPCKELSNEAGTITVAPGALTRGTLSRDDLSRTPTMAVIEHVSRTKILVDYIDIECAAPAADIFRLEAVAEEKMRASRLEEFAGELESIKGRVLDAAAIIESLCQAEKVEEPVRVEALRRLGVL